MSSKLQEKEMKFDADVSFDVNAIVINHRNKDLIETKDWSWIKKIDNQRNRVWLLINNVRPLVITLPIENLTEDELNFLLSKKK